MKDRPECAIKGCTNEGWIMWGEKWLCGLCSAKLNKINNDNMFKEMEEKLIDDNNNLSKM